MESYYAREFILLLVRWTHVFAAILWIGQTFLFHRIEATLEPDDDGASEGRTWMVHGGGFFQVRKLISAPSGSTLQWFKWASLTTWASGAVLIVLTYYREGLLTHEGTDFSVGVATSVISVVVGWLVYDGLVRSGISRKPVLFGILTLLLVVALYHVLGAVMTARSAFIHVGAVLGSIMVANVWLRILPSHRKAIGSVLRGETPDLQRRPSPNRSRHNSYIVLPVLLIMIGNHYPLVTYAAPGGTLVLMLLLLIGGFTAHRILNFWRPAVGSAPHVSAQT